MNSVEEFISKCHSQAKRNVVEESNPLLFLVGIWVLEKNCNPKGGYMNIKWLGHSCFALTESTGTVIVTDPYNAKEVGYSMPEVTATAVTVSHPHKDHDNIAAVKGSPLLINSIGSYEVEGVDISSFRTFHDDAHGKLRGNNLVFTYRLDGVTVCHLGDIGEECSARIIDAIGAVDVLLIPVGGKYTIDAEVAKDYVDKLMPSIVIPMHYSTNDCKLNIAPLSDFVDLFDESNVTYLETDNIDVDRTRFDGDFETEVIVLQK